MQTTCRHRCDCSKREQEEEADEMTDVMSEESVNIEPDVDTEEQHVEQNQESIVATTNAAATDY